MSTGEVQTFSRKIAQDVCSGNRAVIATSGKLFIGARAQIFLAADVATRTLRLAALAFFWFYQ
jgi:hypothetical protein